MLQWVYLLFEGQNYVIFILKYSVGSYISFMPGLTLELDWQHNDLILYCGGKIFNTLMGTYSARSAIATRPLRERYLSLDVLRGLTIALMIVVNTPGSWSTIYAPLKHAAWHGFTITDLVFPTFLFVVGNAMSFSMKKMAQQKHTIFLSKVFKRTLLIFLIGFLLNYFPFVFRAEDGTFILKNITEVRIMGVLQRIALCYCFAALAIRYLKEKGTIIFAIGLLLAYWGIMYLFGDHPSPYTLEGNAALKFDLLIIAAQNLYKGFGIPFDPEGLLSTLPAIVNVIIGYFAGVYIQRNGNNRRTVILLIFTGAILAGTALIWDIFFPINKPLWTSSYVLYSSGLDLLILAALMWTIEIIGLKKWTCPLEVFGKNPLFIYMMSELTVSLMYFISISGESLNGWLYNNLFLSWSEGKNASLLFAISYMLVLWLFGYILDKKKVYIKV